MVSVFLFFFLALFCLSSCGIPTYWQPKNSTVLKAGTSTDAEISFNVNVSFYAGDDLSNAPQLGLALLYVYADVPNANLFSTLDDEFNAEYRGTIPNGISSLSSEYNTAIWNFTVNDTEYGVYAFTDATGSAISAPYYNFNLTSNTDISKSFTLRLVTDPSSPSSSSEGASGVVGVELSDGTTKATLGFGLDTSNLTSLQDSSYIHVYAALSAQGAQYSNIYWSDITYVGSLSVAAGGSGSGATVSGSASGTGATGSGSGAAGSGSASGTGATGK